jgi:uncharacterized membrane protein
LKAGSEGAGTQEMSEPESKKPSTRGSLAIAFLLVGSVVAWLVALLIFRNGPYETGATILAGLVFLAMGVAGSIAWLRTHELSSKGVSPQPTQGWGSVLAEYGQLFGGLLSMLGYFTLALWGFGVVMFSLAFPKMVDR